MQDLYNDIQYMKKKQKCFTRSFCLILLSPTQILFIIYYFYNLNVILVNVCDRDPAMRRPPIVGMQTRRNIPGIPSV